MSPLAYRETFDNGRSVTRLRWPLRWWRRRAFYRYMATRERTDAIVDDPEALRLFGRMDYWDSWGSVVA